jgi:hypothetical protein
MPKKPDIEARVLSPNEYPASITATRGAYTPNILLAAQHPLGLYFVEDMGAGTLGVNFLSRRSKKPKYIASASNMAGAFRRISNHEDQLIHPEAERETGQKGPVSIWALGKRTGEPKPKSQLDRELDAWLAAHGYETA